MIRASDRSQLCHANVAASSSAAAAAPTIADSDTRRSTGAPICIQTAAIARPANVSSSDASVTSNRTSPCWNCATIAVGVYSAIRCHSPPWIAAMKFTIHVPTVTLSVTIAAVAGCSVTDAAAAASAIVSPAFSTWPNASAASSGGYTLPP